MWLCCIRKKFDEGFESIEITCGCYLEILLDKIQFQAYTFVQVFGFQHEN
jgi:hypothetical protein